MFGNLFKPKKSDDEVTMSLVVLTHKTQTSLKKSYRDFLNQTSGSENWKKVKHIGVFSLSLFLVTSQFLMISKKSNKTKLLDNYTNSMIKDFLNNFLDEDQNLTEEKWNKFASLYQTYYSNLSSRFSSFLEYSSPFNEFSNFYAHEIFGTDDLIARTYLDRAISLNLKDIREYIKSELN
jgi:hypothetical protein